MLAKSGIMVGLGETMDEVKAVMRDQRGSELRIPLADVQEARLVFRWEK